MTKTALEAAWEKYQNQRRHCLLCDEPIENLDEHYRRIHIGTYSPLTYVEMYTKLL